MLFVISSFLLQSPLGDYTQNIVVRTIYLTIVKKENWRRLFAVAFLLFLLVEFGSHTMLHAFSPLVLNHTSISANEGCNEDPCQTLILCSESRHERQELPNVGHQTAQQNALLDLFSPIPSANDLRKEPRIPFGNGEAIFRPISPPFSPPKLS